MESRARRRDRSAPTHRRHGLTRTAMSRSRLDARPPAADTNAPWNGSREQRTASPRALGRPALRKAGQPPPRFPRNRAAVPESTAELAPRYASDQHFRASGEADGPMTRKRSSESQPSLVP